MGKTVFVGLSGGVDSAVSAALLKERGFNVVGVFIKIWQPEFIECTWARDRLDAMRVCVALRIPFREIDLSEEYKNKVVQEMVESYSRGVTPNPDILCNRAIKFGSFLRYAIGEGADFIATGHYARIQKIKTQKSKIKMSMQKSEMEHGEEYVLLRGIDKEKDQSYFLYTLTENDLKRTLFPVGGMLKKDVREYARRAVLPVAAKHDSQGLCFVGDVSIKDFLSRYIQTQKGSVLDMHGRTVGTHDGAVFYTTGQRHGFIVSKKARETSIYYIVSTNVKANTVTVSPNVDDCSTVSVILQDIHFVSGKQKLPLQCKIQCRYRELAVDANIISENGAATVKFEKKRIASPGQSLVIYKNDECLGGGVITAIEKTREV